jgi:hypothetical protein
LDVRTVAVSLGLSCLTSVLCGHCRSGKAAFRQRCPADAARAGGELVAYITLAFQTFGISLDEGWPLDECDRAGIHGLITQVTSERTHKFGIRRALGHPRVTSPARSACRT